MKASKDLLLTRLKDNGRQTIGNLSLLIQSSVTSINTFAVLEPSWDGNKKDISCIAPGVYYVEVRYSEKYGRHLIVLDVYGREYILFHHGNFRINTRGCILTGKNYKHIDKDGLLDITNSKKSMEKLMSFIEDGERIKLTITAPLIWR